MENNKHERAPQFLTPDLGNWYLGLRLPSDLFAGLGCLPHPPKKQLSRPVSPTAVNNCLLSSSVEVGLYVISLGFPIANGVPKT